MKCWKCGAENPTTFAEMVRFWRGDRPMREIAAEHAIGVSTLSRIENGRMPDAKTLAGLIRVMGVDPALALRLVEATPESANGHADAAHAERAKE